MTELAVLILIAVLLLAFALLRDVGKRVVVTTRQGVSIRGVRQLTLKPAVALAGAELLDGGSELKGRVEIPFRNVAIVQRLDAPPAAEAERRGWFGPRSQGARVIR